jgi:pyridoxamine 5'-phosphate oxidase
MTDAAADRLPGIRSSYDLDSLTEEQLAPTWLEQFERWLQSAFDAGMPEANAMILATASSDGAPSARTMLLRGVDERGFRFYTNYGSRKGRELAANPSAALVFPWYAGQRQVIVDGAVERLTETESDAYFASRPRDAQVGAVASPQSEAIGSRAELERRVDEVEARLGDRAVPRPEGWGGFLLVPEQVEFWQGRMGRLHDRLRYRRTDAGAWTVERLAP